MPSADEMERGGGGGGSAPPERASPNRSSSPDGGALRAAWVWVLRRREVIFSMMGLAIVVFTLLLARVNDTLLLVTPTGESIAFPDAESSFSRRISGAGIVGTLSAANPPSACMPIPTVERKRSNFPTFLLVERGICSFLTKVQNAQDAGYAAAIVYDNLDGHDLITMAGDASNIDIPAVFITRESGYVLSQFIDDKDVRLYLLPALESSAWPILAISSISLLTLSALLSTFLFVRRQRRRRATLRMLQEPTGLSDEEVKALPTAIYNKKDITSPETCTICLEEFVPGDKLRMLRCNHGFHVACIHPWLIRRPFCPVCKRDAYERGTEGDPSESTHLISMNWHADSSGSEARNVPNNTPGDIC